MEVADGQEGPRRYGRGVFLATVAGGLSSLVWGKAVWGHVSGVVSPIAESIAPILPSKGWRIYTVSGSLPGSTLRPGGYRWTGWSESL